MKKTTKEISWAYYSSPAANRFGFRDSGCWVVKTTTGHDKPIYISGHIDPKEAFLHASMMDEEWNPMFLRHIPHDLESFFTSTVRV